MVPAGFLFPETERRKEDGLTLVGIPKVSGRFFEYGTISDIFPSAGG